MHAFKASALAITSLLLPVGGAQAQSTTLTKTASYYEDYVSKICEAAIQCTTYFTAVPADKQLNINNASCEYVGPGVPYSMTLKPYISAAGSSVNRAIFLPITYNTLASSYITSFNQAVNFKIGAGRIPGISVTEGSTGRIYLKCTITGVLVAPD